MTFYSKAAQPMPDSSPSRPPGEALEAGVTLWRWVTDASNPFIGPQAWRSLPIPPIAERGAIIVEKFVPAAERDRAVTALREAREALDRIPALTSLPAASTQCAQILDRALAASSPGENEGERS